MWQKTTKSRGLLVSSILSENSAYINVCLETLFLLVPLSWVLFCLWLSQLTIHLLHLPRPQGLGLYFKQYRCLLIGNSCGLLASKTISKINPSPFIQMNWSEPFARNDPFTTNRCEYFTFAGETLDVKVSGLDTKHFAFTWLPTFMAMDNWLLSRVVRLLRMCHCKNKIYLFKKKQYWAFSSL